MNKLLLALKQIERYSDPGDLFTAVTDLKRMATDAIKDYEQLAVGDTVQIIDAARPEWMDCMVQIKEIKEKSIVGVIAMPFGGRADVELLNTSFVKIGRALLPDEPQSL